MTHRRRSGLRTCEPPEFQFIKAEPKYVAWKTYCWYCAYDEWPTPGEIHRFLAEHLRYPLEHAEHDVLQALYDEEVIGVHSLVLMRHGEVLGDWRSPLPGHDPGFRIVMSDHNRKFAETIDVTPETLVA